jgi:uncharacterized damage-inducible protein DinB
MTRSELLERLADEHRTMLEAIQGFQAADFEQVLPAGMWSARDVFAHLAIANSEALRALDQIGKGKPVSFSTDDAQHAADEGAPRKRRALPLQKVMEEFRRSNRDLTEAVKRISEAQWRKSGNAIDGAPIDAAAIITHVVEHYAGHRAALVKAIDGS